VQSGAGGEAYGYTRKPLFFALALTSVITICRIVSAAVVTVARRAAVFLRVDAEHDGAAE
jgi:hypothetical protein